MAMARAAKLRVGSFEVGREPDPREMVATLLGGNRIRLTGTSRVRFSPLVPMP